MSYAWQTGTVKSGGEQIYYEHTGPADAPAFFLTHGAGGSHAAWFQQVPVLCEAGYRVVTWDTRGFGNSTYTTGAHGCDAAVADMTAVLDATDVNHAIVAGQSMGGWWATAFALAQPKRTRALVLSNTVAGLWTDDLHEHFRDWVGTQVAPTESLLGMHSALGTTLVQRDPARAFLYQQLNTFHSPPMIDVVTAITTTEFAHADLDATGIRILYITGTDDTLFPAPLIKKSAARLANAQFVKIDDAGHSPYFERPKKYNAAVLRFARGLA